MTTATQQVQVTSLFMKKDGEKGNHIAKAVIAFQYNAIQPIQMFREYLPKDNKGNPIQKDGKNDWRRFTTAEISGQINMVCRDVKVYQGDKGLFINTGGVQLPYEIRQEAQDMIAAMLTDKQSN